MSLGRRAEERRAPGGADYTDGRREGRTRHDEAKEHTTQKDKGESIMKEHELEKQCSHTAHRIISYYHARSYPLAASHARSISLSIDRLTSH